MATFPCVAAIKGSSLVGRLCARMISADTSASTLQMLLGPCWEPGHGQEPCPYPSAGQVPKLMEKVP